ncbi:D-inositol-3-phosphate glycosyltransferase [Thermosporothrix hazakensis]|uniref:D-inositol-3-phosphate glycosyltransferase n=1 Tax=Thermosporothrix hazakensis TaxID=644383 RepID=A0A326URE5_THEHA|nr:glycosyltransferase [Thermosporothrix hazakensis]PZW32997.1 D-inositol-3-phosphate glycosyltransferase [Thermosporothrix hazakensis]GCE49029.1 glycosyl transferase family 1 [Thermosporothrix hazakensis]
MSAVSIAMLSVHTSPLDKPGSSKDAGGMNVYIRALAQALSQRDLNIDIFTRRTSTELPSVVQLSPNVRVIHIEAGPVAPVQKNELFRYLPEFAQHIESYRKQEQKKYDIVHSHYWLSGVAAMPLAELWDVPHLIMFHTLARLKMMANPAAEEPALRLDMEQRLVHKVSHIIAATPEERSLLIRYCGAAPQQVSVIPCGVDLELFTPIEQPNARKQLHLPVDQPVVLFAGRLDSFKGPDVVVRAAALMEEEPLVLIVGGKAQHDREVQELQELAQQLGVQKRVRFLEAQPQQRLPLLYSAADVTVVPSYHETFGLVAVESLACGTPVVATRAGGLMTVVQHGETGFLVPRCPGFFAERLDATLRDPALLARLKAATRPSVMQFSWYRVAQRVQMLYEDLLARTEYLVAQ